MKTTNLLATVGILLLLAVPAAMAFRPEDYALKYGGYEDRYATAATTFQVVKNIRLQVGLAHSINRFNQFTGILGAYHRPTPGQHSILTGNAVLDNEGSLRVQTVTGNGAIDFEPQSSEGWVKTSDLLNDKSMLEFTPLEGGEVRTIYKTEIVKIAQQNIA